MNSRPLVAVGAGVATALLVAVAVIELLAVEFSAIVGLPIGVLAGLVVTALVLARLAAASPVGRAAVTGLAGFGYAVLLGLGVRYVDLLGLRSGLTVRWLVVSSVLVGAVAGLVTWVRGRD